jgi:hypothetical protein
MQAILIAIFAAGVSQEAHVSQIAYIPISLDDLVEKAPLVVRAVYRADAEREKNGRRTFEVSLVSTPSVQTPKRGESIRVMQASVEARRIVRDMANRTGARDEPIADILEEGVQPVSGREYVLFLHAGDRPDEYVLEAQNAIVLPERFEEVTRR